MPEASPREHYLIVGTGAGMSRAAADRHPEAELTVMGRSSLAKRLKMYDRAKRTVLLQDGSSAEEWIKTVSDVHLTTPITKVWSFNDLDQDKAALVAETLGIPGPSRTCVERMHDKFAMREALSEQGLSEVKYAAVGEHTTAEEIERSVGFPLVLKPRRGLGSTGVELVEDRYGFDAALSAARARAKDLDSVDFIAESLLKGKEYSAECVSTAGDHSLVCITEKRTNDAFIEVGHTVPATLDRDVELAIESYIKRVLTALSVTEGVTHTELMVDGGHIQVIESHLRPAGDEIPEMVKDVFGIDLEHELSAIAAGQSEFQHLSYHERLRATSSWQAVEFLFSPAAGTLEAWRGVPELEQSEGYAGHDFVVEAGDTISLTTSSFNRLALVRANGKSPEEAQRRASEALAKLRCVVVFGSSEAAQ